MIVNFQITRAEGLDEVRDRLGNSGRIKREMGGLLNEVARLGEQSAQMYAPERTRRLRRSISHTNAHELEPGALEASVGVSPVNDLPGGRFGPLIQNAAEYPLFVHEGTGLYGRYHRLIRPKHARAMRFVGSTGLLVRKTVRGQRAQPFMTEAYDDVNAYLPQRIDEMVRRILDERI